VTRTNHSISGVLLAEAAIAISRPPVLSVEGISYVFQSKEACQALAPLVIGSFVGALFPDIDLGVPGLEHRTLTHWPVPYLVGVMLAHLWGFSWGVYFCIGCLVHIFLDSFSRMGVPLRTPFGRRRGFRIMRVGGFSEGIAAVVMGALMYVLWVIV